MRGRWHRQDGLRRGPAGRAGAPAGQPPPWRLARLRPLRRGRAAWPTGRLGLRQPCERVTYPGVGLKRTQPAAPNQGDAGGPLFFCPVMMWGLRICSREWPSWDKRCMSAAVRLGGRCGQQAVGRTQMSCARQRECRWQCVCVLRGRLRRQACLGLGFGMGVGEQGGEDFLSVPFKGAPQRRQAGLAKILRSCGHALRGFVCECIWLRRMGRRPCLES